MQGCEKPLSTVWSHPNNREALVGEAPTVSVTEDRHRALGNRLRRRHGRNQHSTPPIRRPIGGSLETDVVEERIW